MIAIPLTRVYRVARDARSREAEAGMTLKRMTQKASESVGSAPGYGASRCSPFSPSRRTILIDNASFVTVTGVEERDRR